MKRAAILTAMATLIVATHASAGRDAFEVSVDVIENGNVVQRGDTDFSKAIDSIDTFDNTGLESVASAYTPTSGAQAVLDFRGLETMISYQENQVPLRFQVPSIGIDRTFGQNANSRDESQEQFEEFLKNNGDGLLTDLLQELAGETAVDPVAGNPNSLMSRMGRGSFAQASDIQGQGTVNPEPAGKTRNAFAIGARFGRHSAGEFEQNSLTVPISYDIVFDDPGYQLQFDLPVTVIDTSGSKSYTGSFGAGFRVPVTDAWSLTPGARVGALGSFDLASAAVVTSGSLTSNYNFYFDDIKLSIANNGGYYKTQSVGAGGFEVDYDLENWMTKNGLGIEGRTGLSIFGLDVTWQANATHTQFFGDRLFIESVADIAASIGTEKGSGEWSDLRLGVTYTAALDEDYDAVMANFGYRF